MRNPVLAVTALLAGTALWGAVALSAAQTGSVRPVPAAAGAQASQALVTQYCVTCHNARLKTGGLVLDGLDLARLPDHAEVWEKVVRKVRAGVMPPQGVRRPEPAALAGASSPTSRTVSIATPARTRTRAGRCCIA